MPGQGAKPHVPAVCLLPNTLSRASLPNPPHDGIDMAALGLSERMLTAASPGSVTQLQDSGGHSLTPGKVESSRRNSSIKLFPTEHCSYLLLTFPKREISRAKALKSVAILKQEENHFAKCSC